MSDPKSPGWNPENELTLPYGVPPQPYAAEPQQTPYAAQERSPYDQLPRYADEHADQPYSGEWAAPHANQPPYAGQQPPYAGPHPPYTGQQPPYGDQPYYGQSQQGPYGDQPHYGQYTAPYQQHAQTQQYPAVGLPPERPRKSNKMPWLLAGAIAVVVALVAGAAVVITRSGSDNTADGPMPTATYTDGLSTPSATPSTTEPTTSEPTPTPTPSPTPTERVRTLKDIDEGIRIYDDVYVKPAKSWRKARQTKYSVLLESSRLPGGVVVFVQPIGYPAKTAVARTAQEMIEADHLTAVKKESVKTLKPANSNIAEQAQLGFSARYSKNGVTVSLVGRCTTMTGVESIHNVTVTLCVEARKDARDAVFRDASRMLASVARSI